MESINKQLAILEKKMAAENYEEKVPQEIRDKNSENFESSQKEEQKIREIINSLQNMI